MPPKKRGRPASKATADPAVDDHVSASEDLVAPPPKKRGRPPKPKQVADAEPTSEDDSAPPPAKKAKGRPKKTPAVVVSLSEDEVEPPKPIKAKQPAKGKKAAAKAVASGDDEPAIVPAKKSNGKQMVENEDDEQDMKPGMLYQLSPFHHSWYLIACESLVIVPNQGATIHRDVRHSLANYDFQMRSRQKPTISSRNRSRNRKMMLRLLVQSI